MPEFFRSVGPPRQGPYDVSISRLRSLQNPDNGRFMS